MADLEEMPSDEVAELLGVSVAAMYSRLYRAREAFGRAWGEQRASGLAAFAPFALWDAGSLLANDRAIPPASPDLQEEVWRRLVASGAVSAAGAGMAGAGAAAAGAVAAKAGIMMSAKQLLLGAALAGLAGAGIYAALTAADEEPRAKTAAASVRREDLDRAGSASIATAPGSAVPVPSATAAESAASAVPAESAAPIASAAVSTEASERRLLDSARDAITRRDWAGAHTALARVRSARNAAERDYLLGIVRSYEQDGGAR